MMLSDGLLVDGAAACNAHHRVHWGEGGGGRSMYMSPIA